MRIYVNGYGLVKISRWFNDSIEDIVLKSIKDMESRTGPLPEVDAIIVSNSFSSVMQSQNILASLIAEDLGLIGKSTFTVENGGAGGGSAVFLAFSLLKSGEAKNVLIVGVEKTSDYISTVYNHALSLFLNAEHESFYGATLASNFAVIGREYISRYGYGEDDLASWPVLMHENALDVPHAQLKFRISREQVMGSDPVSLPIRVLHSPPMSDGAAVLLISNEDSSLSKETRLAEIKAASVVSDFMELSIRENLTEFPALRKLRERIERKAGYNVKNVDIMDISDDYTVPVPIVLEELEIAERGKGLKSIVEGMYRLGDKPSVNLTGGTKARGHPFGATGIYQVAELTSLLSDNRVKNAKVNAERAFALSMGGVGTVFAGIVLEKV
ncbi:MAG: hypothetical protein QW039_00400 [Fervidicoccaceae archaeon]